MTAKEKYADLSVNISVSPCEDAEIIGYDNHQINRITIRIAQFWLFMGARLIFGHDWRDDGVMRAVADFAETASSDGSLRAHVSIKNQKDEKPWRLLNVVPEKSREQLNQRAVHAERNTSGLLKVMTVSELVKTLSKAERSRETGNYSSLPENWFEQEYSRYWVLRRAMTDLLDPGIRICLGGKTEKYTGYYAGVAEEAYFALMKEKPLYLIGGFGGATRAVCSALTSDEKVRLFSPTSGLEERDGKTGFEHPEKHYGIATGNFQSSLHAFGLKHLCRTNGLTEKENEQLFDTTDIELALNLISRGVANLRTDGQLS